MQLKTALLVAACGLVALTGCQGQQPAVAPHVMSQRGYQLLAAGSPKSAITFLSHSVASTPNDPDAMALLALAYALDGQAAEALQHAQQVHRDAHAAAGWEVVAVGIAEMTRQNYPEAIANFKRVLASPPNRITPAAQQWLVLAYILHGDYGPASESLRVVSNTDHINTTALLWSTLLYARQGQSRWATETLTQAAAGLAKDPGALGLNPDDQSLYDSAVVAVAAGKMDLARERFGQLWRSNPEAADVATWAALLSAARGEWSEARNMLKDACENGTISSRGLASQMYSIVCATEDRPEEMVRYMVTGQRLLARGNTSRTLVATGSVSTQTSNSSVSVAPRVTGEGNSTSSSSSAGSPSTADSSPAPAAPSEKAGSSEQTRQQRVAASLAFPS